MLKRLLKRPAFWSLLALIACTIWPLRPLDRSALFPVQFANGKYGCWPTAMERQRLG